VVNRVFRICICVVRRNQGHGASPLYIEQMFDRISPVAGCRDTLAPGCNGLIYLDKRTG
jgi:hypothetical protein